jgi:hypothetical protein
MSVIRKWHIGEALKSFARLTELLNDLTEAEVYACLDLEARSTRRRSVIDRLISRAVRLEEIKLNRQLKEKFYGASLI